MPTAADFSPEVLEVLRQRGIRPEDLQPTDDNANMSGGRAALTTLKGHAGGILGGGAGTLAGVALAPETGGLSLLALPIIGGLAGGYGGQKIQEGVQSDETNAAQQQELAQAQSQHPIISAGTDIAASALAAGGSLNPKSLFRAGRSLVGREALSAVDEAALSQVGKEAVSPEGNALLSQQAGDTTKLRNVIASTALNPAIQTGVSLATGQGLPSGRDLVGSAIGGALFSEPSWLGKAAGMHSGDEPLPEANKDGLDNINLQNMPPEMSGEPNVTKLKMATEPPSVTEPTAATTDTQPLPENTPIAPTPQPVTEAGESQVDLQKQLSDSGDVSNSAPEPKASYIGTQEGYGDIPAQRLYNMTEDVTTPDGKKYVKGSTVSENMLKRFNIPYDASEHNTAQSIPDDAPYQTFDTHTGEVVHEGAYKNRNRIRQAADQRNQNYGAYRYGTRVKPGYFDTTKSSEPLTQEKSLGTPAATIQHISSGTATTSSVLQSLASNPNHPAAEVARHLLSTSDKQSLSVPWQVGGDRSNYSMSGDKVTMAKSQLSNSRTIIEEAVHSLTSKKLPPELRGQGAEYYNRLQTYLQRGDNQSVKDLIQQYLHVADKLGWSDRLFKDNPEDYITEGKGVAGNPDKALDIAQRTIKLAEGVTGIHSGNASAGYAMGDLHEFLAHAFKNEQFQRLLNEMPSEVQGKSVWQRMLDAVKKMLGMDVKTGSMLDRVLHTSSEIVGQERPTGFEKFERSGETGLPEHNAPPTMDDEHHMKGLGRLTRSVIDRVRDIPHSGAEVLSDSAKQALNEQDRLRGQWKNKIVEAGRGLSSSDKEMLNKVKDAELSTKTLQRGMLTTDAQRNYYDVAKKLYSDNADYRIANKEPVMAGSVPRQLIKDPTYWAGMANQKVEQTYRDNSDKVAIAALDKQFDDWNQSKLGMTPTGSAKRIADWKTAIQGSLRSSDVSHQDYFNASRKVMGSPLPPEFRESDPVRNDSRYFDRQAIDNSHYKYIESNPAAMAALGATKDAWGKDIPKNPEGSIAANPQVKALLDQFKGEPHGPAEADQAALSAAVSSAFISGPALETHKLISNQVKAISFADNPYQLSRAIAHAVTNIKQGYQTAKENGVVKLTATSAGDMFNGTLTAAQRMNGLGKAVRDISTLGGLTTKLNAGLLQSYFEYLVPSKISRANGGDVTAQQFIHRMDPTYTVGKTYTPVEQSQLASLASSYVHGTGDIRSMPAWMMGDSEVSGFFKLAHWSVAQTNNFMHDVWTPAVNGNYTPLLMSVFGSAIGGYLIKELREKMSGKKGGIPSLSEIAASDRGLSGNKGLLAYNAIAAMQFSGFGGLLSQVAKYPFDFVYKNAPQGATFPLDTMVTDIAKTVGEVSGAIANDPNVNWVDLASAVSMHVLSSNMQLSRLALNQGINSGLITGLPAEKKMLSDKLGQLRRFDMVEGMPYKDLDAGTNPYMNIEQKKFKMEQDPQKAIQQLPGLIQNIVDTYKGRPDVMMQKLEALKQNQYNTFPSLETMPISAMKYIAYLQREEGPEQASAALMDYVKHKAINSAKASVVP